jgi:transcriptional regulator with XRE-family HTH domain
MKDEVKELCRLMGNKVCQLRIKKGLRQEDLADAIGLGRISIVNIENGIQQLTPLSILRLSKLFNVAVDTFYPNQQQYSVQLLSESKTKIEKKIDKLQSQIDNLKQNLTT